MGSLIAIQYIIGQLNSPVEQMISFIQNWQNARISMDRLSEVHDVAEEEPVEKGLITQLPVGSAASGGIVFDRVSFSYPGAGNAPVLKEISLKIPLGSTTAIVGASGSGKTTLLKLLLKFHEPQEGAIYFGDMALSAISHKSWRRICGAVLQDSFLFSDTIRGNITLSEGDVDEERLKHALFVANMNEVIESLPLGLATKIGMEGAGISMGQRQRVLIARAVYKRPDLIFLDEATNSLDANNEVMIAANPKTFFRSRTVVVVAHRLSTVRHADQIVVLKKGVIVECGRHEELIGRGGEYFTLVKNQLENL